MPVDQFPNEAIPPLAKNIDSRALLVLQRLQRNAFILNGPDVSDETASILRRLVELGLVDPAYLGPIDEPPCQWVSNYNGDRVVRYLTGIRKGPHYEISSSELAAWLLQKGEDRWWDIDGDPLLTGRLALPCPADEVAAELSKLNRPLLVEAKEGDTQARGQPVDKERLDELVETFSRIAQPARNKEPAPWAADSVLHMCWKDRFDDWLLIEDNQTTEQMQIEAATSQE